MYGRIPWNTPLRNKIYDNDQLDAIAMQKISGTGLCVVDQHEGIACQETILNHDNFEQVLLLNFFISENFV